MPGGVTEFVPLFQVAFSVTRYQDLPAPGQGNIKFTAPDQPIPEPLVQVLTYGQFDRSATRIWGELPFNP